MNEHIWEFLSGGFTGIALLPIFIPIEVFKCWAQIMKEKNLGYIEEGKWIISTEGFKGFYRGTCIMMLKEFPGCGIFFYLKFLFGTIMKVDKDESFGIRLLK